MSGTMSRQRAAAAMTASEAATLLDPPLPGLRDIIIALRWPPLGWRHTGRAGRPVPVYDIDAIMRLHAALLPFAQG